MTHYSNSVPDTPPPTSQPQGEMLPLPLHKPFFTYILLGIIVAVWLMMELAGGSTNTQVLVDFGANSGRHIILYGEIWRLFTSMFLHIGFTHLAFNAYALFIFGVEMERIYGPDRFIIIYIIAGLFGSLLSFAVRGPYVLSAGASGAIFGVIGMNLAYFVKHRETLGQFGKQRMVSTLVIIGINLVFGFTMPGIDNLAHLGGLAAGFLLGYGMAPSYDVDRTSIPPRVIDTLSLTKRWWVPVLGAIALAGGVYFSMTYWLMRLGS